MVDNILATGKIHKLFIQFSIPAIISMIIAGTQSIIDGIFLGNFVGPNAMASVNIAQPFMQLIFGSTMMVCMGSLSLIGRKLGAGQEKEAKDTFRTAVLCVLASSITILLLGLLFNQKLASLLGANEILLDDASRYIQVIACFAPAIAFMPLLGFTSRLIGKPSLYLKGTLVSVTLNVTLDYILIKTFGLGITGAALATGMAYVGGFIVVMIPMFNKNNLLNLFAGKFDSSIVLPMLYNGSSEAVISIATAFTTFLFNITFMKIAGEDGVAAFTTINYIAQFGTLLMFGVSDGIGPIISYNYGNHALDRVKSTLKLAFKVNFVTGIFLFLILFFGGTHLISLFAKENPAILELASHGAKLYGLAFLLSGFNIIISGYFTSIGKAKESVIVAASRGILFILIGILLLPYLLGLNGIWLTVPFAEVLTALIALILLNSKALQKASSLSS